MTATPASPAVEKEVLELPVEQEWLAKVLNQAVGAKGVIHSTECEGIAEGKGFLSIITRVHIDWDKTKSTDLEKLPEGVIIKQPTISKIEKLDVQELSQLLNHDFVMKAHNVEVDFYRYLNAHHPPPFAMAEMYYTEKVSEDSGGMLILKDLKNIDATHGFNDLFTLGQVESLIIAMADLQAYGLLHQEYRQYMDADESVQYKMMTDNFETNIGSVREIYSEEFKYSDDELRSIKAKVDAYLPDFVRPKHSGVQTALLYGDLQPNNILWIRNPDGSLADELAALIDMQLIHEGLPWEDIGYLCVMYLTPEIRRANEQRLLKMFYDRLCSKAGKDNVKFTLDDLQAGYRKMFAIFGIGLTSMIKSFFTLTKPTEEKKNQMITLLNAALEDIQV